MPSFPTREGHYLTSAGDMIDAICWTYYGVTIKTTEAVLFRNPFLAEFNPLLPQGLLIALPVLSADDIIPRVQLWDYKQPALYVSPVSTSADAKAAEAAKELQDLTAYLTARNYRAAIAATPGAGVVGAGSGGTSDSGGGTVDDGGSAGSSGSGGVPVVTPIIPPSVIQNWQNDLEPITVSDYDWLAIFYQDASGKWALGKIRKAAFVADATNQIVNGATGGDGSGSGGGSGAGPGGGLTTNLLPTGYTPIQTEMIVRQPNGNPYPQVITILAKTS